MASPSELSAKAIRDYILLNGGKVTNHDLVKYFKGFLTDPKTKEEARIQFKEFVNSVAVIRNDEEGEKYLYLRKKYRDPNTSFDNCISPPSSPFQAMSLQDIPSQVHSPVSSYDPQDFPSPSQHRSSPRQPPPYRAPPPVSPPLTQEIGLPPPPANHPHAMYSPTAGGSMINLAMDSYAPPVPPRRKSSDKIKLENKENQDSNKKSKSSDDDSSQKSDISKSDEPTISVKERLIKFNRLLSESELPKLPPGSNLKKKGDKSADEEDTSFANTDLPKAREWLLACARGDYQTLAKLAAENPRLAKYKSALHWAAKHGSEDLVKLLAGTHRANINERSNGGYTPLHIAMQFSNEEVFDLLIHYGGDPHLRDWSGRKARQYLTSKDTSVSADTFRKIKKRKKHAEKDSGFLRIGSLNVRVKKTTEAFSNFLGVGLSYNNEKMHKTWGSADNICEPADRFSMPPPSHAIVKKRKSRRGAQDFARRRTPSDSPRRSAPPSIPGSPSPLPGGGGEIGSSEDGAPASPTPPRALPLLAGVGGGDSDSDTACGFGNNWQSS